MSFSRQRTRIAVAAFAASIAAARAVDADIALFGDDFESGDYCAWSENPEPPLVDEGEGAVQGLNDSLAQATVVSRCVRIDGTIGAVVADAADFDFFRLQVDRPTLLRLTLAARGGSSTFTPYADVDDDDAFPPLGISPYTAAASTSRQIWLPAAGAWYVFVSDAANWDRVAYLPIDSPSAGGAGDTYRLTLDVETIAGSPVLAGTTEDLEISLDGAIVALRFAAGLTETLDLAEVTAERLSPASNLDAKLFLVRDPTTAPVVVAACDDQFDGGDCATGDFVTVDPRLETVALDVAPYALLVDFFDVYDPATGDPMPLPASFDLEVQYLSFLP